MIRLDDTFEQGRAFRIEIGEVVSIPEISITVSSGGAILKEQTFDPAFSTKEINGPGCRWAGRRGQRLERSGTENGHSL